MPLTWKSQKAVCLSTTLQQAGWALASRVLDDLLLVVYTTEGKLVSSGPGFLEPQTRPRAQLVSGEPGTCTWSPGSVQSNWTLTPLFQGCPRRAAHPSFSLPPEVSRMKSRHSTWAVTERGQTFRPHFLLHLCLAPASLPSRCSSGVTSLLSSRSLCTCSDFQRMSFSTQPGLVGMLTVVGTDRPRVSTLHCTPGPAETLCSLGLCALSQVYEAFSSPGCHTAFDPHHGLTLCLKVGTGLICFSSLGPGTYLVLKKC